MTNIYYLKGVDDAMKVIEKLCCPASKIYLGNNAIRRIFGCSTLYDVFIYFSPLEIVEKVTAYEKGIESVAISIGDELYSDQSDLKAVVHRIDSWGRYQCISESGSQFVIDDENKMHWKKTGKNYSQIKELLNHLRER